jgi:hypothetical protein
MEANGQTMKAVFTVVERGSGKSYWCRVGVGFVNRDGSITLKLDAIPVNGTLQVREWESREDGGRRAGGADGDPLSARPRPRRDEGASGRRPLDSTGDLV